VLYHLNAEALRTQSPLIELEDSLTAFVKRTLGLDSGGRTIRTVKDQLTRLSAADFRIGTVLGEGSRRLAKIAFPMLLLAWLALVFWNSAKPLPPGTHTSSLTSRLSESDVDFLYGSAQSSAALAREASVIDHAEQLIVIDRSPVGRELALRVLARKRARPNLKILLVTDPGNEAFGGTPAHYLTSLEKAGIIVARVRLDRLRDSNPLYSGAWRLLFGWWSDPFDEPPEQVTLRTWSRMQNFKADRRQLMMADDGSGGWTAVIGPSAAAVLILRGSLARSMIASELQIAGWSTDDDRLPPAPQMDMRGVGSIDARFLTEGAIESALLDAIAAAGKDDLISIAVENLSDRRLIAASLSAAARGAHLQVLLARNRIPNQAVAGELLRYGGVRSGVRSGVGGGVPIEVRWYPIERGATHPALLIVRHRTDVWMNLGSANFTRRSLGDFNLESSVELRMPARAAPARAVSGYFAMLWLSAAADTDTADESAAAYWRYRVAEATGLSSF
jgi:PLD-like domain